MRLVLSSAARGDLKNIAAFTAREWGEARKKTYMAALGKRFAMLRRNPEIGVVRDDLDSPCRSLLVGSHVLFYKLAEGEILVIRVLHQRMDVRRHL